METNRFSFIKRLLSFKYAFNGIKYLLKYEHNSRIHLFATVCVIILGIILKISTMEWIACIILICIVLFAEIVNSAIEKLCDFISIEKKPEIKIIKDLAAAGVLFCAFCAVIIGFIIFLPKILNYF